MNTETQAKIKRVEKLVDLGELTRNEGRVIIQGLYAKDRIERKRTAAAGTFGRELMRAGV